MRLFLVFLLIFFAAETAVAKEYRIDKEQSKISFSGTHAGNDFQGNFEEWDAQITFDPENLKSSSLTASFNPASAKTGNAMYDGTLPQADWFDVKNHPEATFQSTSISATEYGHYKVTGDLTIRGITHPVYFDFTLSDLSTVPVSAEATLVVDRLAYDIGKKSDAKAEWVSQNIDIQMKIVASPTN